MCNIISLYDKGNGKGNEVIFWYLLHIWSCLFFWVTIVIACFVMNDACSIIFGQAELAMKTFTKVQKPSLMIKKSIHWVWRKKRWETSFYINVPLSKTKIVMVSQIVLWITMRSFLHKHQSKWIPKSLMVCSH
jgi:hypothetical protein